MSCVTTNRHDESDSSVSSYPWCHGVVGDSTTNEIRMQQWFKDEVQHLVDERMARDYEQRMEETIASIKRDYDKRMEENIANIRREYEDNVANIRREYEEKIATIRRDYNDASGRIDELERQLPLTNSKSTDSVFMTPSESFFVKFTIGQLERSKSVCNLPHDIGLRSKEIQREVGNVVLMAHC